MRRKASAFVFGLLGTVLRSAFVFGLLGTVLRSGFVFGPLGAVLRSGFVFGPLTGPCAQADEKRVAVRLRFADGALRSG